MTKIGSGSMVAHCTEPSDLSFPGNCLRNSRHWAGSHRHLHLQRTLTRTCDTASDCPRSTSTRTVAGAVRLSGGGPCPCLSMPQQRPRVIPRNWQSWATSIDLVQVQDIAIIRGGERDTHTEVVDERNQLTNSLPVHQSPLHWPQSQGEPMIGELIMQASIYSPCRAGQSVVVGHCNCSHHHRHWDYYYCYYYYLY